MNLMNWSNVLFFVVGGSTDQIFMTPMNEILAELIYRNMGAIHLIGQKP